VTKICQESYPIDILKEVKFLRNGLKGRGERLFASTKVFKSGKNPSFFVGA